MLNRTLNHTLPAKQSSFQGKSVTIVTSIPIQEAPMGRGWAGVLAATVLVQTALIADADAVVVYSNAEVDEKWLRYLLVHMDLNQYSTDRIECQPSGCDAW